MRGLINSSDSCRAGAEGECLRRGSLLIAPWDRVLFRERGFLNRFSFRWNFWVPTRVKISLFINIAAVAVGIVFGCGVVPVTYPHVLRPNTCPELKPSNLCFLYRSVITRC